MARLDGKVVLVTGGGNGIGRAFSRGFAAEGAKVVVADIDLGAAGRVAGEISSANGVAKALSADVTSSAQVDLLITKALEAFGQIDVLINNAAVYPSVRFTEITEEQWDRVVNVNLKGTFLCSQAVARHMMERKMGKIINIASDVFYAAPALLAHYVASKAGVIGLTRAMARELGAHGINVNCLAPGLTRTETAMAMNDERLFSAFRKTRSIQRDGEPEDLVGAALFLASSESDFMTGQTLLVEGGSRFA